MEACKPLSEYAWAVHEARKNKAKEDLSSAIDRTITDMPDDFIIKPFLVAHRAEVRGMLLTEYNEAETMEMFKEEGRAEGILKTLAGLIRKGLLSLKDAALEANMTETEFASRMAAFGV
jgi:hypothetical protein